MSKTGKFLTSPGEFWRDFLLKRYPEDLDGTVKRRGGLVGHLVARRAPAEVPQNTPADLQTLEAYPVTFPIDIVYTWVDGSDPTWLARKNAALPTTDATAAATTPARFACRGELKYSLRSLEYFAPWVNHIYIVTDGQVPPWLDTATHKITVVDHTEIISSRYLPTFNSHVIEAHLHKIPGLAERYVYFNDDVMLTRPTPPEHFFSANGNAHLFLTRSQTPVGPVTLYDTPTQVAAKNARDLLHRRFGQYMLLNFAHTFHPQLKSVNEQIAEDFASEIAASCGNRFRGRTDVAFATYLAPNYAYLAGRADLRTTACMYFNVRSPGATRHYRALLQRRGTAQAPYSMCLNDTKVIGASDERLLQQEIQFLERYYPEPSSLEKCTPQEACALATAPETEDAADDEPRSERSALVQMVPPPHRLREAG